MTVKNKQKQGTNDENYLSQKIWHTGAVNIYVDPPLTPLVKIKIDFKTENHHVKIKLHRYPMSENWTYMN